MILFLVDTELYFCKYRKTSITQIAPGRKKMYRKYDLQKIIVSYYIEMQGPRNSFELSKIRLLEVRVIEVSLNCIILLSRTVTQVYKRLTVFKQFWWFWLSFRTFYKLYCSNIAGVLSALRSAIIEFNRLKSALPTQYRI